ncbi:Tim44/TimA family putative adaptor protein [Maricaulis sp.]|uniref:Tim44/TimA family putative adaptor protein n=1 Tax=Maricaulis sp. TaxID=1486257 RepID=UPI0025C30CAC|nr:Tim44/TimA family putative adaptor protein [Maricaulis sp.]
MDIWTLIGGIAAIFFAYRLYTALGRREGHMEAPAPRGNPAGSSDPANASGLRPAFEGPAAAGLEAIAAADSRFDPDSFLEGARSAYTMIVQAFAAGDRKALEPLLATSVLDRYTAAIDQRADRGETVKTEIERIKSAEITEAGHSDHIARVKVRFVAEIATETRDQDGVLVQGDLGHLSTVTEDWQFERRTDTGNPNWVLTRVAAV